MTYEFLCTNPGCGAVTELVQRMSDPLPDSIPCKYCQETANFKYSAPAVLTGTMSNKPFDVAVGRDAEIRWKHIHEQQARRDKIRREAGQVGLHGAGYGDPRPITPEQKKLRTDAIKAVERDGFKADPLN